MKARVGWLVGMAGWLASDEPPWAVAQGTDSSSENVEEGWIHEKTKLKSQRKRKAQREERANRARSGKAYTKKQRVSMNCM